MIVFREYCKFMQFLLLVLWTVLLGLGSGRAATPTLASVRAEAAVLIVADTNEILWSHNEDKWMHPASTTKMLTLLTAIEKRGTRFDELATITPYAVSMEPSIVGLKVGDQVPLQDVVSGMMVASGNDAAVVVAENTSGSVSAFAKDMNRLAKKIGATHSRFLNPHGLTQLGHHTTAKDLALIAAYGMRNQMFRDMVGYKSYTVHYQNRPYSVVYSTNRLLRQDVPYINGIKTGYTEAAGDCLVASSTRQGVTLIAVLLNDDYRWEDAPQMLDYGFAVLAARRG